jgi:hypothetical protein
MARTTTPLPITVDHILATYHAATTVERVEGTEWYPTALKLCTSIAKDCGLPVATVVGVCAAISPNNKWDRNITDTENLCRAYALGLDISAVKVATYNSNKAKAIAILECVDDRELHLAILSGQKVKAFYLSILGEPDAVCVDGHAYSVWLGEYLPTTKTPSIGIALHKSIVLSYIAAKDAINAAEGTTYTAAQIQAVTWVAHKRIHAR